MKIFLSFLQSEKKHPIPAYDFWQHYIKNGIVEAGHEWSECPGADWALGLVPKSKEEQANWKQDTWQKTIAWLKKNPVDLFLGYLYPEQIDTSAIKEIQKTGVPCVNFFCDHIRLFTSVPAEFKVFDLNWVPEYKATEWYKESSVPYINLPMPMWVDPKYRVIKEETNQQVTFIGSNDIQRSLLFEKVMKQEPGLPLAIYGNGWKEDHTEQTAQFIPDHSITKKIANQFTFISQHGITAWKRKNAQRNLSHTIDLPQHILHPSPAFEGYNRLIGESMVSLGVNRYPSFRFPLETPDSYSRLRDIEAPMLGACYLTEWTGGIEQLYDIENEIAVFHTESELVEQVKMLQADPAKRKKLKTNGQKKALSNHSIPQSLNRLFNALSL